MKTKILSLVSAALFIVVTVVCSGASFWVLYQPKQPKALQK